jgi:hypothetical protein
VDFGMYFSTIFSTFRMARRSGHVAKWYLGDQNRSPTVRTEHFEFIYPENVGFTEQAAEQKVRISTFNFIIQDRLLQQSMDNARHVPHAEENAVQPF